MIKHPWVSKEVKQVVNEQAEHEGLCVYRLIELALGLDERVHRRKFKPINGPVHFPPHIRKELTDRAIQFDCSENKVLENLFDVRHLKEG